MIGRINHLYEQSKANQKDRSPRPFMIRDCILGLLLVYILLIMLTSSVSMAKDFGTHGHTFPIIEENILEVIEKKLSKIDLQRLNKELRDKTQEYVENPPAAKGITKAKENKIFYFDPSYTLLEDIYDHNHLLIHAVGKIINPLEHVALRESLIFIDGDDDTQVKTALNIRKEKQDKAKIILVKGSPLKIQRLHKVWIYFDQAEFITKKLGITEVPAHVEQEGLRLKISVIGGKYE